MIWYDIGKQFNRMASGQYCVFWSSVWLSGDIVCKWSWRNKPYGVADPTTDDRWCQKTIKSENYSLREKQMVPYPVDVTAQMLDCFARNIFDGKDHRRGRRTFYWGYCRRAMDLLQIDWVADGTRRCRLSRSWNARPSDQYFRNASFIAGQTSIQRY